MKSVWVSNPLASSTKPKNERMGTRKICIFFSKHEENLVQFSLVTLVNDEKKIVGVRKISIFFSEHVKIWFFLVSKEGRDTLLL